MKRANFGWLALLFFSAVSAFAADPGASSLTVQVPGGDKMLVTPPAGWKYAVDRPPPGMPPTADITSPGGMIVRISFMKDPKAQFTDPGQLDKKVTDANQQYISASVEKRVILQRFAATSGFGVYSVFTDPKLVGSAKPPAGEFRHFSTGALSIGRQVLIFFVFSNSRDNDEYRQAFDFLANGISVAAGGN